MFQYADAAKKNGCGLLHDKLKQYLRDFSVDS
jgi:hypothetical protein